MIVCVQCWNASSSSLLFLAGSVLMFVMFLVISSLNFFQSVLFAFILGMVRMVMALVVIFTITRMWFEEASGPGFMEILWKAFMFERTTSGVVAALCEKNIGNLGPRKLILFLLINIFIAFHLLFVSL